VVDGYQRTEKARGNGSPMVILELREWLATLYAVAASTVPGAVLFGPACTSKFKKLPTCKWLN
jgi:hypothetical protein